MAQIAGGMDHTLILTRVHPLLNGVHTGCPLDTRGWGRLPSSTGTGEVGQLGLGDCGMTKSPIVMGNIFPRSLQMVAAGYLHSVVITLDGAAFTCGLGKNGRLGLGLEGWGRPGAPFRDMLTQVRSLMNRKMMYAAAGEDSRLYS